MAAYERIPSELDLSYKTISINKVLRIDSKEPQAYNDKIKIITIACENVQQTIELLKNLDQEKFPNAFVLTIEVDSEDENEIESIKRTVNEQLSDSHPFLIQLNTKYFLRRNKQDFQPISLDSSEEETFNSLNFSTKIFLKTQEGSKIYEASFDKFFELQRPAIQLSAENLSEDRYANFRNWLVENILKCWNAPKPNGILNPQENPEQFFLGTINSQDDICLRLLNLFEFNFSHKVQDELFCSVIHSKKFELLLAYFDVFEESKIIRENVQRLLGTSNAFKYAVERDNFEVVKFLLKFDILPSVLNESLEIAIKKEFFKMYEELKTFEGSKDERYNELVEMGEKVLNEISNLHDNIESGNLDEVKKISDENPDYRLCYGRQNICALERAIDCKQFKIYSYLRAKSFYTDKGQELDDKISQLSESQKHEIRIENLKYTQEFPDAFIGILISKCKFDALSPVSADDVKEMLTRLSRNEMLRPFLQLAAQADLKIIFDFATESVKSMDPNADEHTMGLAYFSRGELYVGRDRHMNLRYGTFIHELTHMILYLVYENDCLPYVKNDNRREIEWNTIVENESANFHVNQEIIDEIIRWVFQCYNEGYEQEAELAVRPNHIMARYFDNEDRVQEIRMNHIELFNYLRIFVLPDIRIPNVLRLININNEFNLMQRIESTHLKLNSSVNIIDLSLKERIVLSSNVPKLALSKLFNDIENNSQNALDIKVKNIFVDAEKLDKDTRKEVLDLMKSSKTERVILDLTNTRNDSSMIDTLYDESNNLQLVVVCSEKASENFNASEYEKCHKNFCFEDLDSKSQALLNKRKVIFQGKTFQASKFFNLPSGEVFALLCGEQEILINPKSCESSGTFFVPRCLQNKMGDEFEFENFLNKVQGKAIVLISNIAGSGKTTFLKKVCEYLHKEYSEHWISFVSLIDTSDEFSIKENFEETFASILSMNSIERQVFTHKFSKGEVKILFDAFDEVSQCNREKFLKFFKLFQQENKNQIWITTRIHLEHDLENKLQVENFKLKVLPKSSQIEILCELWKNSHNDSNFINRCAVNLTQKISEMVNDHPNLIGIPIILQSVAKIFADKINENFPNEIKNLKLSKVFERIIEDSLNILASRYPEIWSQLGYKRTSIRQVHEFYTIVHYFDVNLANSLGLFRSEDEFSLEELVKCGILCYDENGRVKFVHETHGEFFLTIVVEKVLRNVNSVLSDLHLKFIMKVLTDEKFEITRVFLWEMLEDFDWRTKLFEHDGNLSIFEHLTEKNFLNCSKYFLCSDFVGCQSFEEEIEQTLKNASERLKNEAFDKFLNQAQENFHGNFMKNFLLKFKFNGLSFFESLAKTLSRHNFEKILMCLNEMNETILHLTVGDFLLFKNILNSIKANSSKEFQKEFIGRKNVRGENIAMTCMKNESSCNFVFKYVESLFTKTEMEGFLIEVDDNGMNILHHAALNLESKEILDFLWHNISQIIQNHKLFLSQKEQQGRTALQLSSTNNSSENIFPYFLGLIQIYCENEFEILGSILDLFSEQNSLSYQKREFLCNYLKNTYNFNQETAIKFLLHACNDSESFLKHLTMIQDYYGPDFEKFLLHINQSHETILNTTVENFNKFKIIFNGIKENSSKHILKKMIQLRNGKGQNVMMVAACKNENSLRLILEFVKRFMRSDELERFCEEVDQDQKSILHHAYQNRESNESFELLREMILDKFERSHDSPLLRTMENLIASNNQKSQKLLVDLSNSQFNFDGVPSMSDFEVQQFRDDRGFTLLMVASEAGRLDVVQNLIDRGEEVNIEVEGESAASIAYAGGHYEVVLALLRDNAKFPDNLNREILTNDLRNFLDLSNQMHERVRDANAENLEEVKIFLRQNIEANPTLRYFYDANSLSLLKCAILRRQFSLYEFLLSLNICLAPYESMDEINKSLTNQERETLSDINFRISPNLMTEPMMILAKRTYR